MHLTNFSVNKNSKDFQSSEGLAHHNEGSKRSVTAVLQQMYRTFGLSPEDFWVKVSTLSANTLMALRPGLIEYYVHENPRPLHPLGPKGFQIIGLDVLIDSEMEPRLLELNANPSLSAVQPGAAQDAPTTAPAPEPPTTPRAGRAQEPRGAAEGRSPARREPSRGQGRPARLRSRARFGLGAQQADGSKDRPLIATSELDLKIKEELVAQALLLARPAPQNKAARARKAWVSSRAGGDLIPLGDDGSWALERRPSRAEAAREDAPERCPALEAIDFEALAAPEVIDYARAQLALYRFWRRACGQGHDSLGQAQALKGLEKVGLVGEGEVFESRVTAQLWLSRVWREVAPGGFGLNLPQFVEVAGRIGRLLALGGAAAAEADGAGGRSGLIPGVIEFARRVVAGDAV